MFAQLLTPYLTEHHPCKIEEVHHTTNKFQRIVDTLEPLLAQHRLVVSEECIRRDAMVTDTDCPEKSLFYQLTHVTREPKCIPWDDRLDCLACGVEHFASTLAVDVVKMQSQAHQRWLAEEVAATLARWDRRSPVGTTTNKSKLWRPGGVWN